MPLTPSPPGPSDATVSRRLIAIEVALDDGQAAAWRVRGELWEPGDGRARTVQVLLSGVSYDRRYWLVPGSNNYARHMVRAGHAVLALDRIGTGQSDRPPAGEVSLRSNVYTLHQIVQALRAGRLGEGGYDSVIVVGHSFGSGIAMVAAGRYRDIDGLVLTGFVHAPVGPKLRKVKPAMHPASEDPVFAPSRPASGYLTTRPGARADLFHQAGQVDPSLSRFDEQTKSTTTAREMADLPRIYNPFYSVRVNVPVLLAVGRWDGLFSRARLTPCGASSSLKAYERLLFRPGLDLEAFVLPDAGHSLNLHRRAPEWFDAARAFADRWTR